MMFTSVNDLPYLLRPLSLGLIAFHILFLKVVLGLDPRSMPAPLGAMCGWTVCSYAVHAVRPRLLTHSSQACPAALLHWICYICVLEIIAIYGHEDDSGLATGLALAIFPIALLGLFIIICRSSVLFQSSIRAWLALTVAFSLNPATGRWPLSCLRRRGAPFLLDRRPAGSALDYGPRERDVRGPALSGAGRMGGEGRESKFPMMCFDEVEKAKTEANKVWWYARACYEALR